MVKPIKQTTDLGRSDNSLDDFHKKLLVLLKNEFEEIKKLLITLIQRG